MGQYHRHAFRVGHGALAGPAQIRQIHLSDEKNQRLKITFQQKASADCALKRSVKEVQERKMQYWHKRRGAKM